MKTRAWFNFRPDIPFHRDDSNRFLPWMIALMVCLTVLMLSIGFSLKESVGKTSEAQQNQFAIHIPYQTGLADKTALVMKALTDSGMVAKADALSEAELKNAIRPWMGDMTELNDLPLPTVIRIQPKEGGAFDAAALTQLMQEIDPAITIDGQSLWAEKYAGFAHMVRMVLYGFVLFIALCLTAMVVFAARTTLKLHRKTVSLLHTIGANDDYISRQFQMNAARLAFRGTALGSLIALLIYTAISLYIARLDAPLLPPLSLGISHIVMLLLLPPLAAGIGYMAARFAVLQHLRLFP